MSWSLGEIATLCAKAARGAGRPWGVAEEIGVAVYWLAARELPGPEALARLIEGDGGTCPVTLGLATCDTRELGRADAAGPLSEPLLVLPFLARLAPHDAALEVATATGTCRVWRDGTDLRTGLPSGTGLRVVGIAVRPEAPPSVSRVAVIEPGALEMLQASAARTYAPATEASRLSGAGAGLIDND